MLDALFAPSIVDPENLVGELKSRIFLWNSEHPRTCTRDLPNSSRSVGPLLTVEGSFPVFLVSRNWTAHGRRQHGQIEATAALIKHLLCAGGATAADAEVANR